MRLRSITASSSATTRKRPPFRSLRNRFFVCPPAILPRKAFESSTVNKAGWSTVVTVIPSLSRKAKRSSGDAGTAASDVGLPPAGGEAHLLLAGPADRKVAGERWTLQIRAFALTRPSRFPQGPLASSQHERRS